ncbi:uncharacterized protein MONOS_8129 [Monocercomonoides exilis]|uniref:uncharacterized protein n=1 Tax=Monocercomonoides exilis TaxID=2049356 RepID=UPI00355A8F97|nr:hypothetical protein MONOS_8129 [Monocercomonoides exilis]|eukprot:MONOS_8129.1-p1 / transcript=MONOS_8129.1 / gene=MONOS_8129 / organism=Monocercomonoides_exilis_PA203 / gene_product=unspecified product / transcript_product=unspecified product / location=Mono_scaffold00298:1254-2192(+) / protein_length=312 / sequence_SO=supercontig / SO=protein_coding / is_pseudo=false
MMMLHFKFKSERTFEYLIQKDNYAITLDLAQAYCLIPVSPELKPYLSFRSEGTDYSFEGILYEFMDAPRIFTKIMRNVTRATKKRWNVRAIAYLDDMTILHHDKAYLEIIKSQMMLFLGSLGLMNHKNKCQLEPTKRFTYLGFDWDTEEFTARLGKDKATSLEALLSLWERKCVEAKQVRMKDFASLIGKINAVRFIRQDASLRMVALHRLLQKNVRTSGWSGMMKMNASVLKKLLEWKWILNLNKPRQLQTVFSPQATLTTDASELAMGATLRRNNMILDWRAKFRRMLTANRLLTGNSWLCYWHSTISHK